MDEFSFDPATVTVSAGETISFVVTNTGLIDHELRITNEPAALEHLESGHADHDTPAGHHDEFFVVVAPGMTGTLTVSFDEADEFDLVACLLPGHYESGMYGPLTVEG